MKARLEYTFDLPEERYEMNTILNAGKYHSALWDFSEYLCKARKLDNLDPATYEAIRAEFWGIIDDRRINLDM